MIHVVDDQLGAVADALHTRRRRVQLLAPAAARRLMVVVMVVLLPGVFRRRGRLVQVLPRLPVVPVQAAAALGPGRVQRGHRVRVRRRTVTVMFGTAIPAQQGRPRLEITRSEITADSAPGVASVRVGEGAGFKPTRKETKENRQGRA